MKEKHKCYYFLLIEKMRGTVTTQCVVLPQPFLLPRHTAICKGVEKARLKGKITITKSPAGELRAGVHSLTD